VYARDLRGGPVAASAGIDHDGYEDLVTGEPHSPDADGGETTTGGLVGVYRGSPLGTDGADGPPQWWTQDTPGVPGEARCAARVAGLSARGAPWVRAPGARHR
jgi:hypothetical protein